LKLGRAKQKKKNWIQMKAAKKRRGRRGKDQKALRPKSEIKEGKEMSTKSLGSINFHTQAIGSKC
jgi:hypothetical protein